MAERVATTDTAGEDRLDQLAEKLRSTFPSGTSPELYEDVNEAVGLYLCRNDVPGVTVNRQRELEELLGSQHGAMIEQVHRDYQNRKAQLSSEGPQTGKHHAADPVMMFNGQFTHAVEDLRIRGAGMDFAFARTYKNQTFYDGPLGYNWDHSHNLWLREEGNSLVRSTGELREDRFIRHEHHGYYVPPEGQHGVIEPEGGSFALRTPGGSRFAYERVGQTPSHRIRRIEDRNGNYLAFGYDSEGHLARVEVNSPARHVDLVYDSRGRIETVVAYPVTYQRPEGERRVSRTWRYSYDDFGDLVAVTGPGTERHPEGATTRYEYSSASYSGELAHNLIRVTDPKGNLYLENEYGTQKGVLGHNRVVRQRQGNGEYLIAYEDVIPESGWEYGPEEMPAHRTVLYERNGHAVEHLYNARGNLLVRGETILEGCGTRELVSRYRYNRDGALVASLSPEGRVTQHYHGREDFYGRTPGAAEQPEPWRDARLTKQERLKFGNVLGSVRRGRYFTLPQMNLARGLYGDIFPSVMATDPVDVVVKSTYEPDYQQIASVSDPRHTASVDPRHAEANDPKSAYNLHLTRYEYGPLPRKNLLRVRHPDTTFPASLPGGQKGLKDATEEFLKYDAKGRLLRTRDAEGGEVVLEYLGGPQAGAEREGYLGKEVRAAGKLDLTTSWEVNEAGVTTAATNPRGVRTRFVVDELDRTTETVSGGPGFRMRTVFDRNGLVERRERDNLDVDGKPSPDGNEVATFRYDTQDNLVRETLGGEDLERHLVTRHSYDASDKLVRTVKPRGNAVRYGHDQRLLPRTISRGTCGPFASTTKVFHDGDGRKSFEVGGRGHATRYAYDALGNLLVATDPEGNLTQFSHDKLGNVTVERFIERRDAGKHFLLSRRSYEYDERGSRIGETSYLFEDPIPVADPEGAPDAEFEAARQAGAVAQVETRYFYDKKRRLFRVLNAKNQETLYEYDAADRRIVERDALGNYTRTFYDENSNVIRVDRHEKTGPNSEEVFSIVNEYDDLDRRVATIDGLGNVTLFSYDSRGNLVAVEDPLGNTKRFEYDVFGRKTAEIAEMTATGLGGGAGLPDVITRYFYDENGNLTGVTDARGNTTRFEYDPLDRLSRTVYADASATSLEHDADDHVVAATDNNGLKVLFDIDPLGRKTRAWLDKSGLAPGRIYPAGAEEFEEYRYDGLGRVVAHRNDFCEVSARFDSLGRAVEERTRLTTPYPHPLGDLVLERAFDALSNRTGLTYPGGRSLGYDYDALNRLVKIRNLKKGQGYPGSSAFPAKHDVATYEYRGLRLAKAKYGNGAGYELRYDGASRVISTKHSPASGPAMTLQQLYDGAGNRRFRLDDPAGPAKPKGERYSYDSLYRLTRHERKALTAIDPAKFAPSAKSLPVTQMVGQKAINKAIGSMYQAPSNYTYRYDALGNREEERPAGATPVTYTANSLNEYETVGSAHVSYDLNGNLVDDGAKEYMYDWRNLLVQVRHKVTDVDLLELFYDAVGRLICIKEGTGALHFINDGLNVLCEYAGGTLASQYVHGTGIDELCQMVSGKKEWWYHCDVIGSTRMLSNPSGKVPTDARYDYHPFGSVLTSNAHITSYLFAQKRLLKSVGIYHSRARQYVPRLGRFLQRDPKGFIDGPNLYVYGGNNPATFVDPLGTDKAKIDSSPERAQMSFGVTPADTANLGVRLLDAGLETLTLFQKWDIGMRAGGMELVSGLVAMGQHPLARFGPTGIQALIGMTTAEAMLHGYHEGGRGGWGILNAINRLNPLNLTLESGWFTTEAWSKGHHAEAGYHSFYTGFHGANTALTATGLGRLATGALSGGGVLGEGVGVANLSLGRVRQIVQQFKGNFGVPPKRVSLVGSFAEGAGKIGASDIDIFIHTSLRGIDKSSGAGFQYFKAVNPGKVPPGVAGIGPLKGQAWIGSMPGEIPKAGLIDPFFGAAPNLTYGPSLLMWRPLGIGPYLTTAAGAAGTTMSQGTPQQQ